MEWASDLPKGTRLMCFYSGDDASHPAAAYLVHDARGCVACCEQCTRWRAGQSRVSGHHGEMCDIGGAAGR